jgi:DNA-binding CsgD family transcriptional regulator
MVFLDDSVLRQVYTGAVEAQPWQGLVAELRARFGADDCALPLSWGGWQRRRYPLAQLLSPGTRELIPRYREVAAGDPFQYDLMSPGMVYRLPDVVGDMSSFQRSEFYLRFGRRLISQHWLCLHVGEVGHLRGWLLMSRGEARGPFSADERKAVASLGLHLIDALAMAERLWLEQAARRSHAGLDALGSVIVDAQGTVLLSDGPAEEVMDRSPRAALASLLQRAQSPLYQGRAVCRLQDPVLGPLEVRAVPCRSTSVGHDGLMALHLRLCASPSDGLVGGFSLPPPSLPAPVPSAGDGLAALQLTPAERRLTLALCSGVAVQEAASQMGITAASARSYLKRIYARHNIHSQSALVAAALQGGLAPRQGRDDPRLGRGVR